ncbi:hypothetical protein CDD80_3712 [Ophiocordyceps camponoti-rufipedis]|uniref:Enhancer of mRNA-decapping protein 3 n=1 Tax=Ophiocordyceps camponoti-rufipedis TaxID=2004952 RepID=A0A2C5Z1S0_9HYPO|nr:hypothetical protein CDD80_3712 [Ophiocordyceps camponoti-rufipedis]
MASQFIGLQMSVLLKDPPGYRLVGIVRDVEAGSSLTLTNVLIPSTQKRVAQLTIRASNIEDLSEVANQGPSPTTQAAPSVPQQPTFVDPAILSVGRRPASETPSSSHRGPKPEPTLHLRVRLPGKRPEQDLLNSIKGLSVNISPSRETAKAEAHVEDARQTPVQKKKNRVRNAKQTKRVEGDQSTCQATPIAMLHNSHGKGWRQTPILETASFQPFHSLKRQARSGKGFPDNGWASEDVTEEMGDFDFANNLAKFDKRTIFDQMRREDQTDDASRLVSHNRRAKPGTAGGKNLHYSENVLDVPSAAADFWNSEADVGVKDEAKLSGKEARNGQGGRRSEKKTGPSRRSQSRKASVPVGGGHPLSRVNSTQQAQQPGLYLMPSNRRLEAISTLQMLNLENIAANELGFTEALMAENAGRGIAEVIVTALSDPALKVRFELAAAADSLPPPTAESSAIVILAGNNKSGIRALVAARHLRNKNLDVLVCLVGIERERDLLEELRRQIQLFRCFGGKVGGKDDLFEQLREPSPVAVSLIVDALLGLTMSFEELRIGDQATVYELMEWANRNEAFVLAIDVPTGIDPTTGAVAIIDGSPLFVKPRYVVAIGAPKKGLVEAISSSASTLENLHLHHHHHHHAANPSDPTVDWRLFVADMGLGGAVWKKAGAKVRKGVDFDGRWVLEMRYRSGELEE